jgi:hypothetical protein
MFTDIAIVLGVAAVGIAIVFFLFNSVSDVPKSKKEASKVIAEATAPKPKSQSPAPKKTASKKDKAAKEAADREIEELIAREARGGGKGMGSDKTEVITLDDVKARAKAKKDSQQKQAAPSENKAVTEEQKAKDRAHGFKVVEAKEDKKPESPAVASPATGKTSGTRRASPASPAAAQREDLEKKLSQFFKGNNRRRRGDEDEYVPKANSEKKQSDRVKATKVAGGPGNANAWAEDREW